MSAFFSIRVRDDADGFYASARGEVLASGMEPHVAAAIVQAAVNGADWEVIPDETSPTP